MDGWDGMDDDIRTYGIYIYSIQYSLYKYTTYINTYINSIFGDILSYSTHARLCRVPVVVAVRRHRRSSGTGRRVELCARLHGDDDDGVTTG